MRIDRVRVDAFGTLVGYDTGPDPLPGLVVVYGPNEAGKSTLFHFLTTALYGFRPATRDGNPYVPWGADEAGGSVDLALDGGGCVEVTRRLRSQPTGRMSSDGRGEELRNRELPWVEHIPRAVFSQVFAIRLQDLAGLDDETWSRVQDRILGSMGASDLIPAREVAAELEREAGEVWRPHRRGNQRVRDLQREVRELRAARREALERDRRMRSAVGDRDAVRDRTEELRERRSRERVAHERIQALLPVRKQLRRIEDLRRAAGAPEVVDGLPARPQERLDELSGSAERLASRRSELESELTEPRAATGALGERESELLSRTGELTVFLGRVAGSATERARIQALAQEAGDLERRLLAAAGEVLSEPWTDSLANAVRTLSMPELRAEVRRVHEEREASRAREVAEARGGSRSAWAAGGFVSLAAGGALLGLGLSDARPLIAAAGGVVLVAGLALLSRAVRTSRARPVGAAAPGAGTSSALNALLEHVPVAPHLLREPGADLVHGLQRVQDLAEDLRERARTMEELGRRLAGIDRDAAGLAASLGLEAGSDGGVTATLLDRELRRAERLAEAAKAAERDVARLNRELTRVADEEARVTAELTALRDRLRGLGDGEVTRGVRVAEERLGARLRADELSDELEREHADLDELKARIARAEAAEESWTVDEDHVAALRVEIEHLTEGIEELTARSERLDAEVTALGELDTVDAVDGRIALLEEDVARLRRARDRRWVLARLLREADRRFREEHQPDLMRRASSYLEHLTDGRYQRIVADELGKDDVFHLVAGGLPAPLPLSAPVSTGTLEQAYLALRLAIVDHLDQGRERLPLFIDEVFVNWDPQRRGRGIDVIAGLAGSRQLFVFTCHPETARELEGRGGRLLKLTP